MQKVAATTNYFSSGEYSIRNGSMGGKTDKTLTTLLNAQNGLYKRKARKKLNNARVLSFMPWATAANAISKSYKLKSPSRLGTKGFGGEHQQPRTIDGHQQIIIPTK